MGQRRPHNGRPNLLRRLDAQRTPRASLGAECVRLAICCRGRKVLKRPSSRREPPAITADSLRQPSEDDAVGRLGRGPDLRLTIRSEPADIASRHLGKSWAASDRLFRCSRSVRGGVIDRPNTPTEDLK